MLITEWKATLLCPRNGKIQPRRERAAEGFIGVGLGAAELVINVDQPGDGEPGDGREGVQDPGQRNRIRPARQGHRDPVIWTDSAVLPNRAGHAGKQIAHWKLLSPAWKVRGQKSRLRSRT